ncbi:MAG: response regulator transcription factor [Sphingobacteriales bacterium]|nr:MAG: response regulator transcription factor [Sphingobacteriales bacterium]
MIKAIIVDDEKHCVDTLEMLLTDHCSDVEIIDKCRSAKEALNSIRKEKPDVLFLDIEMPHMDGFDLLQQFSEINFAIIFTTSYDQYAIKAIQFSALDYLLKPINAKDLKNAVKKIVNRKMPPLDEQFKMLVNQMQQKSNEFTKIAIPTSDGFALVAADNILRCEANDTYTNFFLKNKLRIIACRSLKEVEEQLEPFSFFVRVHHSFIVNMNEVSKYVRGDGGYVIMSDGIPVSVSRSRKEMLLKWF